MITTPAAAADARHGFRQQYLDVLQRMQQRPINEAALQRAQPKQSWFSIAEWTNSLSIDNDLVDVRQRVGDSSWGVDQQAQQTKIDAFRSRHQRAARERELRLEIKRVTTELKQQKSTHARKCSLQRELTRFSNEKRMLESKDALLLRRTRRYRLKPSVEQVATLKQVMHACRFTYNKCVEYERKTGKANKALLQKLFVTRQATENDLAYPEGMGPSPEWVVSTPASVRQNAVHRFVLAVSAVSAADTNLSRGNITHFNTRFKGRKQHN